ncbi:MAG: PhoH family protein [Desulfovibrionaceae bacterium]
MQNTTEYIEFDEIIHYRNVCGEKNAFLHLLAHLSSAKVDSIGCRISVTHESDIVRRNLISFIKGVYTVSEKGHELSEERLQFLYTMFKKDISINLEHFFEREALIFFNKKRIYPKTFTQREYISFIEQSDIIFGVGPAGTGKTFLAVAMAIRMLQEKKIKRILLTRPAVEAGEKLGFLHGALEEKVDPYLRPLYDALYICCTPELVMEYFESKIIEVAPLAFMRGRTIENAVIILDEAQNSTTEQMKMFLTRLGKGSKMIITGDITQIDLLPLGGKTAVQRSGLIEALHIVRSIEEIPVIYFKNEDVVRHPLVIRILAEYDFFEERK